jgi:lipopolysaccharide export system protein LptC
MAVEEGGKVMIFENRVRMSIDPAATRADEKKSGDTNATQ